MCDVLQVEGDTVTFSFEMRSGREHNTPDKAMWGFACTVRAQVRVHLLKITSVHYKHYFCFHIAIIFRVKSSNKCYCYIILRFITERVVLYMCRRSHQRMFPAVFRSWLIWLWVYRCWPVPCCASSTTALTSHERRRPVTTSCAPNSCSGQPPSITY